MTRIITKGLLGSQDLSLGTSTFSRTTSTGGTITLNQISGAIQIAGSSDLTAQAANITSTTLVTTTASGLYRVHGYSAVTRAATTTSTLPSIVVAWTDADSSQAMTAVLTPSDSGNGLTTVESGSLIINAKTGTTIGFSTTGYATSGATTLQYSVHLRVEGAF